MSLGAKFKYSALVLTVNVYSNVSALMLRYSKSDTECSAYDRGGVSAGIKNL